MQKITVWKFLEETINSWLEDRAQRLAAALSYYTIFALAPLLIIAIAVAAVFFDEAHVRQSILTELGGLIGQSGRKAIEAMIEGARQPTAGIVATTIGVITLIVAAGGFFGQLQDAINTIWEVQPKPGRGFWGILRDRFLSFAMVLGTGFLLLVSLMISTALTAAGHWAGGEAYGETLTWQIINIVVSFGVTTILFAMIFKILPDAKVRWRDVWIGALVTAVLFSLGRFLISWYLGQAATESTYGAAGSLVALLIWVYYSSQILFLGAEFTWVYAKYYGSRIEPSENAVRVTKEERNQQGMPSPETVAAAEAKETAKSQSGAARSQKTRGRISSAATVKPGFKGSLAGTAGAFVIGMLLGRRL